MDDLPTTPISDATKTPPSGTPQVPVGSMAKETSPIATPPESPLVTEVGKEIELPPEVTRAGVTMKSDTVVLPKTVAQMGVSPAASTNPQPTPKVTVTLPLNDDQIAQGVHQSIMTSWRWLAEWCTRQLKQAHVLIKSVGGKTERIST